MDTSDPHLFLDDDGKCNHCRKWDALQDESASPTQRQSQLADLVESIQQQSRRRRYGCVIGISGGIDSCMVAFHAAALGLRPLAVHVDTGWNTEAAVWNVQRTCQELGIPLVTHVVEWETFRQIQLAYLRAGVVDADAPTDQVILAGVYRTALRTATSNILAGTNTATELVLPHAWVWPKTDVRQLKDVVRRFAPDLDRLRGYPTLSTTQRMAMHAFGIRWTSLLDLTGYDKRAAIDTLSTEVGWRDYGGKHHESVWTRWYQGVYLLQRFRIDKRRAHLASLVLSSQLSRTEALKQLDEPVLPANQATIDSWFVERKLGMRPGELDALMTTPGIPHARFRTERSILSPLRTALRRGLGSRSA